MFKKYFSPKVLILLFFVISLWIVTTGALVQSQTTDRSQRLYPSGHQYSIRTIDSNYRAVAEGGGDKIRLINTNESGGGYFVPLNTNNEWVLFQNAASRLSVQMRTFCGDGVCNKNYDNLISFYDENSCNCPIDCPGTCSICGNGSCETGEDSYNCPEDCNWCGDGICVSGTEVMDCFGPGQSCACTTNCFSWENVTNCPADCKVCGDGICSQGENELNCNDDCGWCGDLICNANRGENVYTCSSDCTNCGDGICSGSETNATCPQDCQASCGNFICEIGENPSNCGKDCPGTCGDGICAGTEGNANENAYNCSQDCPAVCGDGYCTHSENSSTCLTDCPLSYYCGDGICNGSETPSSCPNDCGNISCFDDSFCPYGSYCYGAIGYCSGPWYYCEDFSNDPTMCMMHNCDYSVDFPGTCSP